VRTRAGAVTADRVVVAMNAWATRLREVRRSVVVIASDVIATAPIPERLGRIGWTSGTCIDDSRLLVNYYRTTWTAGWCSATAAACWRSTAAWGPGSMARRHAWPRCTRGLRHVYPMLADAAVTHSWTGPIDRTAVGLPFFWRLGGRDDLLCGAGYSGNGVGPSRLGGDILASLALGSDDEWARCGLAREPTGGSLPPEPLRSLGGRIVREAVARKERAEDHDRRPVAPDARDRAPRAGRAGADQRMTGGSRGVGPIARWPPGRPPPPLGA
jgi:glycine/D-amino acid oxidase-like deaminating enzyme